MDRTRLVSCQIRAGPHELRARTYGNSDLQSRPIAEIGRRDPSHAPAPASALRCRRPARGPATAQKAVRRGRGRAAWRLVVARPRRGSAIAALLRGEGVPRWGTPVPGGPRPAPASAGRKAVRAPALRRLRRRWALGLSRAQVSRGLPAPPAAAPASPPPPLPASLAPGRARGSAPCQRVPPQGVCSTCCRWPCVRPPSPGLRGSPFGESCRGRFAARVSPTTCVDRFLCSTLRLNNRGRRFAADFYFCWRFPPAAISDEKNTAIPSVRTNAARFGIDKRPIEQYICPILEPLPPMKRHPTDAQLEAILELHAIISSRKNHMTEGTHLILSQLGYHAEWKRVRWIGGVGTWRMMRGGRVRYQVGASKSGYHSKGWLHVCTLGWGVQTRTRRPKGKGRGFRYAWCVEF